ncbi:MAG: ATP-binding protein [Methanobacteriota archaeon]
MHKAETDTIVIHATIDAIEQVAIFLEEKLEKAEISMIEAARIQLAVEEAVTNVVMHGYDGEPGNISIWCKTSQNRVIITITDTGSPFDPTTIPPANIIADLDNRNIGGLGVHLIRSVMDEVTYSRDGGKNQLTLVKKL